MCEKPTQRQLLLSGPRHPESMEGVETPSKTWKSNKAGRNDPHPMHGAKAGHPGHRIPPSTSLNIGVETAAGLSNQVETRVEQATPGILATGASGGSVSIRATGIIWLAKFPTVRLFVRITEGLRGQKRSTPVKVRTGATSPRPQLVRIDLSRVRIVRTSTFHNC
jgi:hypothetical protein